MEYKKITRDESMGLSKQQFIDRCLEWNRVFNDGEMMDIQEPTDCPVHIWIRHNRAGCAQGTVANTDVCPVCGCSCCPVCGSHYCEIVSRVTGYLSNVASWNSAKAQEFKDRQRTDVAAFA